MARELKVVAYCDMCSAELSESDIRDHCLTLSINGGATKQIDLCIEHYDVASALVEMYEFAPVVKGRESAELTCPDCGFVSKSKAGLGRHRASHK